MRPIITYSVVSVLTFCIGATTASVNVPKSIPGASEAQLVDSPTDTNSNHLPKLQSDPILDCNYDPKEFNPRGVYYIMGDKPKDFREFDSFALGVYEINGVAWGDASFVTISNQMENGYYSVSGSVKVDQLSFVAKPISDDDYTYRFDGYFLRGGDLSKKRGAVLEGKLIKLKGCIRIAESSVRFRVEYFSQC